MAKRNQYKLRGKPPRAKATPEQSLDEVLADLRRVNDLRRRRGLLPLSYGKFVAGLEGRTKEKERAPE